MEVRAFKICGRCKEVKPASEFYSNKSKWDGLSYICRSCERSIPRKRSTSGKSSTGKKRVRVYKPSDESREKTRLKVAEWRAKNPERNREQIKAFHSRNPKKRAEYDAKRRGAPGKFTTQEWRELCESLGNKCLCCGKTGIALSVDHIVPISKGGSNDISNLQPLCRSCNSKKNAKEVDFRPQILGA